ncbi:CapA family protein [Paenibacillus sp.]|uniref:CapA family protein n=1 Tax=Paenibacillus sp. TaxID=58172 RepID=UPI0028122C37|nr:CapA family protein [Paenibacillus sp.]
MSRTRTETMRRRRASSRRRKLAALNAALLIAVGVVVAWNVWASNSGGETADERPMQENPAGPTLGETEAPGDDAAAPSEPAGETGNDGEAPAEEPSADGEAAEPESGTETPETETPGAGGDGGRVKLAFVGDVLLGEYVGTLLERNGFDYPYPHVKGQLQGADLAIANLETSVTSFGGEKPGKKQYEFRSDPDALPAFKEAGFDLVNLANNHTLDFGPDALRDTMKHLEESDLLHVGAGETIEEAYAPVYVEKDGLRIAVFGFTRVVPDVSWKVDKNNFGLAHTYDYTEPVKAIKKAAGEADLVVVMAHWGEERAQEPHPEKQVDLGRRFIDAGADLVVGSHPHVLQGFERYGGGWIAYSLGNFIFTKSKDPLTYEAAILEAECGGGGDCSLKLTPYFADTPQPQPMPPERTKELLARLDKLSVGASVDAEGNIESTDE